MTASKYMILFSVGRAKINVTQTLFKEHSSDWISQSESFIKKWNFSGMFPKHTFCCFYIDTIYHKNWKYDIATLICTINFEKNWNSFKYLIFKNYLSFLLFWTVLILHIHIFFHLFNSILQDEDVRWKYNYP